MNPEIEKLRNRRIAFVSKHSELFDLMIKQSLNLGISTYLTVAGKEILINAREELGYSDTYTNMDLMRSLMNISKHKKFEPNIILIKKDIELDVNNCKYYDKCKNGNSPFKKEYCCINKK